MKKTYVYDEDYGADSVYRQIAVNIFGTLAEWFLAVRYRFLRFKRRIGGDRE